ncbi:MAG: HAD-IIB family hydrolase [Alphaproteobacteria bacterium]|nr:HAD-IIB family hydrolase [Alphaproteobacteria bacterium]
MIAAPKPLVAFPPAERRRVRCVLTDIDDTLTTEGRLTASAFTAMERLARGGIAVVPVTGRPAGWCDMIARQWPVAGVVGENGAFHFRYDPAARRFLRGFWVPEERRRADHERLWVIARRILAEVPGTAIASDQQYRAADIAVDWCEDVPALPDSEVRRIVAIAEAAGATAKVSSIHVNIWFGDFSKLAMTRRFTPAALGLDVDADRDAFVFVGDSPNDQTMFGHFPNAVGVANVLRFADQLTAPPAYVATQEGGDGFAEVADALLAAR